MSEEDLNIQEDNVNEGLDDEAVIEQIPVDEVAEVNEVDDVDPIEQEARSKGWRPPEEFEDDGKEALSAEAFLAKEPLFQKIKEIKNNSRRETHRLEKKIEEMQQLMREERKRGYEQAFQDLQDRRREAVEIGDTEAFQELDTEYFRVKQQLDQVNSEVSVPREPVFSDDALSFKERNSSWFNFNTPDNAEMVNQAGKIDDYLSESKPYLSEAQRYALVEREIKEIYKDKFSNPKRNLPPKVETNQPRPAGSAGKAGSLKVKDLTPRQKQVMEEFLQLDPTATAQDYLSLLEVSLERRR